MTRKHYEALATALASVRPEDNQTRAYVAWAQACIAVSDECRSDNPNFDPERFRLACMGRPTDGQDSGRVRASWKGC